MLIAKALALANVELFDKNNPLVEDTVNTLESAKNSLVLSSNYTIQLAVTFKLGTPLTYFSGLPSNEEASLPKNCTGFSTLSENWSKITSLL